uniref:Uncharacterized protein n=1 Tax=Panagrolaimus superbus TaxID=310955 RepID=A0A914Y255_9BILA
MDGSRGSYPIVRAKSTMTLPRARDIERGERVGTLTRVTSVPNINSMYPETTYRPSTVFKYRRDWELLDDYWHDRYTYNPSVYWQDYRYAARRYASTDPIPNSLGFGYPAFWSRYKWYSDYLNPLFYRRYRDPYYDRPLYDSWRPYQFDRYSTKRAVKMFRQGLISFNTLDKKWIEPTALGRREKDWSDVYQPAGRYGARRYFYSFN